MLALFSYRVKNFFAAIIGLWLVTLPALAATGFSPELDSKALAILIGQFETQNSLHVLVTPEIINGVNHVHMDEAARADLHLKLENMQEHKTLIANALKNLKMPADLVVLPLVESGYVNEAPSKGSAANAGIWQLTPETAKGLGLVINKTRDDRLSVDLSTYAALNYLQTLHRHFKDWRLVVLAYHYGEQLTDSLIKQAGSRDPWTVVRSPAAPLALKGYLVAFDTSVIVMHNPALVAGS
jgi:hypothetical protein